MPKQVAKNQAWATGKSRMGEKSVTRFDKTFSPKILHRKERS
jgi:hypothetical protein